MSSAARLGTFAFAFWAAKTVSQLWNASKQAIDDERRAERNEDKARRDLAETQKRSDEKDTESIRREISKDWVDRERKNLPPAPKSIRGHWEGHVFIPSEQPDKAAQEAGRAKARAAKAGNRAKAAPKATGG